MNQGQMSISTIPCNLPYKSPVTAHTIHNFQICWFDMLFNKTKAEKNKQHFQTQAQMTGSAHNTDKHIQANIAREFCNFIPTSSRWDEIAWLKICFQQFIPKIDKVGSLREKKKKEK